MAKGFGKRYYAASYGHRYGDPCQTFVSLRPGKAGDVAERAMQFEADDLPGYCDGEHGECDCETAFEHRTSCAIAGESTQWDCPLCTPDLCFYGEYTYTADDLFTNLRELGEYRHDLAMGKVIVLSR